ncbi:MAG: hypothetical protein WAN65_12590 [Candidatus Sulfotelmatobacter sp.]
MSDKIEGYLEVGLNERDEIVINVPPLNLPRDQHKMNCIFRADPDENCNCGCDYQHIVFSINQAQRLSHLLADKAMDAAHNIRLREDEAKRKAAEAIPVDRSARVLASGSPVTPDHLELKPNGQQKDYVVLSDEERRKGFVRPVRRSYQHLACGCQTSMSQSIAETYARDPEFYSGTFCCHCGKHFDLVIDGKPQFTWIDDGSAVGS